MTALDLAAARAVDAGVVAARIERMADRLAAAGYLTRPQWRQAMRAVPRHLFAPGRAWCVPDGPGDAYGIDADADPARWWEAVYSDAAVIIQVDDGRGDPGTGDGAWTSSLSAPGAVAAFLELLAPRDHDRVLEIGTGPGWTAGLLSERLGAGNVVSIEVDPAVADLAAANLHAAGYEPTLVAGDGADGWADGAPYDAVHVTCGVTTVPYTWVEQTRPGGTIVLPWMPEYIGGYKVRLTVGDGRATGRFHGPASYMMLRSQRGGPLTEPDHGIEEEGTRVDPRAVTGDSYGADIAITAMLPDVAAVEDATGDGRYALVLADTVGTSWARVEHRPGRREHLVRHAGPRPLWDEVTDAYLRWVGWGSPGRDRFGLTVDPHGQVVWRDDPANVITPRSQ
ncbi:protein-L-isoaspartate(D-aspartate) O-methyltransferase [Thermomonospora echinospora]|uniref:Protein-L-isoaspartate O-methyltransferase n=1 Tax=Thermomonospora echinospora TaxID=1992 RepID=A0A1H6DRK9_9ACTN|nr:methyltransferase domain-containing protein [Thermomonospora echinospora]SEG87848.1 protein-L-isoaspartate(D-aspartate) O-methyltransferase [Thermomonospora echinospora]